MLSVTRFDISFLDIDAKLIRIPAGTEIFVDIENGIGFANELHFSVSPYEYYTIKSFEEESLNTIH